MFTLSGLYSTVALGPNFSTDVRVEPGWFLADPTSLYMESGTVGGSPAFNIDYRLRAKTSTTITFQWTFMSMDATNHERFGYIKGKHLLPVEQW
ncbi:MAG: hypothetical protein R2879_00810 [Saprospiraceae bacterium]